MSLNALFWVAMALGTWILCSVPIAYAIGVVVDRLGFPE